MFLVLSKSKAILAKNWKSLDLISYFVFFYFLFLLSD